MNSKKVQKLGKLYFLLLTSLFFLAACSKTDDIIEKEPEEEIVTTTKDDALTLYQDEYLLSDISNNNWTGADQGSCNPGSPGTDVLNKTIKRINYFRNIVGLDDVELDVSMNSKAQEGAYVAQLQFDVGNNLSPSFHTPSSDWT